MIPATLLVAALLAVNAVLFLTLFAREQSQRRRLEEVARAAAELESRLRSVERRLPGAD